MLTDEFGQRVLGVPTLIKHMTNQIKLIYKHLYEGCQKKKNYKTFCKNTLCICISHPISSRKKKRTMKSILCQLDYMCVPYEKLKLNKKQIMTVLKVIFADLMNEVQNFWFSIYF